MERLNLTTPVLGRKAAEQLKKHLVTQTIRSDTSPIIAVEPGQLLEITLDGVSLGVATLLTKERFVLAEITVDDARRGGFDDRVGLVKALHRAGFRFRRPSRYHAWRLRFDWRQPSGITAPLEPPPKNLEAAKEKRPRDKDHDAHMLRLRKAL